MKQPWFEYITQFGDIKSIEDAFIKLRQTLRDSGFTSEEDLVNVSSAPTEVFMMRDQLISKIENSRNQLKRYGLWDEDISRNFDSYISRKLSKLEKKHPLSNGN
mgnify:FL=1|jgi:hypothetical protein|tara:strand:- start:1718 stop:2029 length:312 start_codon:yes stop_codon:yes gene_type:complete